MSSQHRFIRCIRGAAMALALAGSAATAHAGSTSGSVAVTSDYLFRGVSQTNEDPFVFGTLDVTAGDFYGGIGAENVDFGNDIDLEYDANGNLTKDEQGRQLRYDALNRLVSVTTPEGESQRYHYDPENILSGTSAVSDSAG